MMGRKRLGIEAPWDPLSYLDLLNSNDTLVCEVFEIWFQRQVIMNGLDIFRKNFPSLPSIHGRMGGFRPAAMVRIS